MNSIIPDRILRSARRIGTSERCDPGSGTMKVRATAFSFFVDGRCAEIELAKPQWDSTALIIRCLNKNKEVM